MVNKKYSPSWKRSVQPRKQRKYRYNAPLHVRQKFMHVHLSPELRKKYSLRNIQLKTDDKVKILRGQFKKKEGKVERIDLKREKVFIIGMERIKKEGTKSFIPFNPTNLMIIELDLNKKRKEKLGEKTKSSEVKTQEKKPSEKVSKKEEIKKETPTQEKETKEEQVPQSSSKAETKSKETEDTKCHYN